MKKSSRFYLPIFALAICLLISSCAIYKQEFDCPPPNGVPCTSETDLESMIIETDKGPDLFLPMEKVRTSPLPCSKCVQMTRLSDSNDIVERKIWICHQQSVDGCRIQGHYIHKLMSPTCPNEFTPSLCYPSPIEYYPERFIEPTESYTPDEYVSNNEIVCPLKTYENLGKSKDGWE